MSNMTYYAYTHSATAKMLVDCAKEQEGENSERYTEWYGIAATQPWCAVFVSWCAQKCGLIEKGVLPRFASCTEGFAEWFKPKGLFRTREMYEPKCGDLIFFNWNGKKWGTPWDEPCGEAEYDKDAYTAQNNCYHVGIVEKVEDGKVYTIEGNSGSAPNDQTVVERRSYDLQYDCIRGYCIPNYYEY